MSLQRSSAEDGKWHAVSTLQMMGAWCQEGTDMVHLAGKQIYVQHRCQSKQCVVNNMRRCSEGAVKTAEGRLADGLLQRDQVSHLIFLFDCHDNSTFYISHLLMS